MSTTTNTTDTARYTLSCHVVMAPAGKAVGQQLRCPECSDAAGKTVRPRIKAIVNPTGDETVDAALGHLADELVDPFAGATVMGPAQVADAAAKANVSDMAKARTARLAKAKAAAAAGQDPATVLAEPLPAKAKAARKAKADDWCVRFRNMSAARLDAIRFAGWDHDGGPLVICDPQAAAAFVGLLTGSLNRVSDLPQPTDKQRRTIEQMLKVAQGQRAKRPAADQA